MWDDEDFSGPPPVVGNAIGNWDDEDADPNPKSSWDEDTPKQAVKKREVPKPKADKKTKVSQNPAPEILDPLTEKLRKQKLVEESDYQNTQDIFNGVGDKKSKKGDESLDINTFQPTSEAEFEQLATALIKRFSTIEGSGLYVSFLKSLIRQICTPLRVEDCKEISAILNIILNDKLKAEKEKTKPKRKGGGATSGKKSNIKDAFDYDGGAFDDDGDDFM